MAHEAFEAHTSVGSGEIDTFLVPFANIELVMTLVNVQANEAIALVTWQALALERTEQVHTSRC